LEYTALWGPKGFIVSPSKIVPLLNFSTTYAMKADTGNDASGTATTNAKGRELQTVSLSTIYVRGAGVDPRGQIAEWEALVGKSHPLYIEGQRFGPKKLTLKSVDVTDTRFSNTGKFLQVAIALKFEEYTNNSNNSTQPKSESASKAEAVFNAMKATASAQDKAEKKPTVKGAVVK
jgi:hypothetical protein